MSTLSANTIRRCLEMAPGAGNTPERTHMDGYEGHAPKGRSEMRDRLGVEARRLWVERLRESAHRADHGVIQ